MLVNSSGTNHVLNKHEDFYQYGPYILQIQANAMLQLSCKFVNQNVVPIE